MLHGLSQIALAHLALSLIPGQSLALVTTGIAAHGVAGGVRAVAGITAGKTAWTLGVLALMPWVLRADPSLLIAAQLVGGVILALVGTVRLIGGGWQPSKGRGNHTRRGFAGTIVNPATCVFFLSAFPALAIQMPLESPVARLLCLAAIAATSVLAMVPWFALGLAAYRVRPQVLRTASGVILLLAGGALVIGTLVRS